MTNVNNPRHTDNSNNNQSSTGSDNGFNNVSFVHEDEIQCDNPVGNTWSRFEHFLSDDQSDSSQARADDALNYSPSPEQAPKLQCRWKLRRVMESFPVRVFTLLFILADISLVTTDLVITTIKDSTIDRLFNGTATNSSDSLVNEVYRFPYELADFIFSSYFVVELLLRVIVHGLISFIRDWRNDVEIVIVFATFLLSTIDLITTDTPTSSKLKYDFSIHFIFRNDSDRTSYIGEDEHCYRWIRTTQFRFHFLLKPRTEIEVGAIDAATLSPFLN